MNYLNIKNNYLKLKKEIIIYIVYLYKNKNKIIIFIIIFNQFIIKNQIINLNKNIKKP